MQYSVAAVYLGKVPVHCIPLNSLNGVGRGPDAARDVAAVPGAAPVS